MKRQTKFSERFKNNYKNESPDDVLQRMVRPDFTLEDVVWKIIEERERAARGIHTTTHFIQETFQRIFMDDVAFVDRKKKAMLIGLREHEDGSVLKPFKQVNWLLLYTQSNYVFVLHQSTTSIAQSDINHDNWKLVCYHGSCWINSLESWVEHFIGERGCFLSAFTHIWMPISVSDDMAKAYRKVQQRACGENGLQCDETFMWRVPNEVS